MSTEVATIEKIELKTQLALQIRGEIISSNLPTYSEEIRSFIAALPTELKTDEDFDAAKQNVKSLKTVEDAVKIAREESLKQAQDLYDVLSELDSIGKQGRATRLKLDKLIKAEDARVRKEIKEEALKLIGGHTVKQEQRIDAAMKGKRLLKTLRDAAMKEAEAIRNEVIEKRKIISDFIAEHGESLGYDDRLLMEMDAAALRSELDRRLERQRHEAEQAKLKAEADAAKAAAEKAEAKGNAMTSGPMPAAPPIARDDAYEANKGEIPESKIEEETVEQELTRYLETIRSAMAPMREARLALKYPENIAAATAFAEAINPAFLKLKGGQS